MQPTKHRPLGRASAYAILLLLGAACARTPETEVIDATAALPAPGTTLPPFNYPSARGGSPISNESIKGQPTVLVLWSRNGEDREDREAAMRGYDSLFARFSIASRIFFATIVDEPQGPALDSLVQSPELRQNNGIAIGWRTIAPVFDRSASAPKEKGRRVAFRLPSFLVVDENGRVLKRVAGRPYAALSPTLDSITTAIAAIEAREDSAFAREVRPRIEALLRDFNPGNLQSASDSTMRLDQTCGSEETVPWGLVPATAQLLDLAIARPGIYVSAIVTSVATGEPEEGDDVCRSKKIRISPEVRTDTLKFSFQRNGVGEPDRGWTVGESLQPASIDGVGTWSLIELDQPKGKLLLPDSVTLADLRTRIDSIRRRP